MEKAAAQTGIFERRRMQQRVQEVVAHICTGGIGNYRRQTGALYPFCDCFDRQRRKVRGWAIWCDRFIDRLIACVVRDTGVHQVDCHALRRDSRASPGLSHAENRVGLLRAKRAFQDHAASDKLGWNFKFT